MFKTWIFIYLMIFFGWTVYLNFIFWTKIIASKHESFSLIAFVWFQYLRLCFTKQGEIVIEEKKREVKLAISPRFYFDLKVNNFVEHNFLSTLFSIFPILKQSEKTTPIKYNLTKSYLCTMIIHSPLSLCISPPRNTSVSRVWYP